MQCNNPATNPSAAMFVFVQIGQVQQSCCKKKLKIILDPTKRRDLEWGTWPLDCAVALLFFQLSSKKFGFMGITPSLKYLCSKAALADIRFFGSNMRSLHNKSRPFASRKVCLKCGGGLIGKISCNRILLSCVSVDRHRNILAFGSVENSGQFSSDGAPSMVNILSI